MPFLIAILFLFPYSPVHVVILGPVDHLQTINFPFWMTMLPQTLYVQNNDHSLLIC